MYNNSCNYNHYNNHFATLYICKILIQISSYKLHIVNNYVQLKKLRNKYN